MWLAGGGSRPGTIHGQTDDFSYNIVKDPVHVHDFHATILHLLGFDHRKFSVRYQGLDQRLTGVEPARVVEELLA
jgi:arylsulfatase A-like enzyme